MRIAEVEGGLGITPVMLGDLGCCMVSLPCSCSCCQLCMYWPSGDLGVAIGLLCVELRRLIPPRDVEHCSSTELWKALMRESELDSPALAEVQMSRLQLPPPTASFCLNGRQLGTAPW